VTWPPPTLVARPVIRVGDVVAQRGMRYQCVASPGDRHAQPLSVGMTTGYLFKRSGGLYWCVGDPWASSYGPIFVVPRDQWTAAERVKNVLLRPRSYYAWLETPEQMDDEYERDLVRAVMGDQRWEAEFGENFPVHSEMWERIAGLVDQLTRESQYVCKSCRALR
jgi:hypothetical protein